MVDDRLEDVLASVGRSLVIDVTAGAAVAPTRNGRRNCHDPRRRLFVAAMALAVVVGAVVSIAPARRAVGGWLRAGRIDVSVEPNIGRHSVELPSFINGATPIERGRITELLGQRAPDVESTSLGPPNGWWTVPEGGVVATWESGATSLWIVPTDQHQSGMIDKLVDAADLATGLPQLGDGGFAVSGAHVMQTEHRRLAADSVVAWQDGALTFRFESEIDLDKLITIAEAITTG